MIVNNPKFHMTSLNFSKYCQVIGVNFITVNFITVKQNLTSESVKHLTSVFVKYDVLISELKLTGYLS